MCLQLGERLLGMDNHGAQQTPRFKEGLTDYDIRPAYTPPNCTDCVSPCDHHVGIKMKNLISAFYKQEFEDNRDEWCDPVRGLKTWERRVRMATWAAKAWEIVRQDDHLLRQAFVSTGFLIAKDGSEKHLIKIPGVPDYDFEA